MNGVLLERRVRYLPTAIENAEYKLAQLYKEARRYNMTDLVNAAWETALSEAQADAFVAGGSVGFGDGKR